MYAIGDITPPGSMDLIGPGGKTEALVAAGWDHFKT